MRVTGSVSGSASGLLNVEGDGDKIGVTQVLTEGTKIATITINEGTEEEETIDLYAPEGFSGSWNDLTDKPTLFSGVYADLSGKPYLNGNVISGNMYSDNYSLTEQVVGTWVDGRPLYKKTFYTTSDFQLVNYDYRAMPWNSDDSNIDFLVNAEISRETPNTGGMVRFYATGSHITGASLNSSYTIGANTYVTFKYTKSTDSIE